MSTTPGSAQTSRQKKLEEARRKKEKDDEEAAALARLAEEEKKAKAAERKAAREKKAEEERIAAEAAEEDRRAKEAEEEASTSNNNGAPTPNDPPEATEATEEQQREKEEAMDTADLMNTLNGTGGEDEEEEEEQDPMESTGEPEPEDKDDAVMQSPPKKGRKRNDGTKESRREKKNKKKKDKKKKRSRDNREEAEPTANVTPPGTYAEAVATPSPDDPPAAAPNGVLKNKFGRAAGVTVHKYAFEKVILEGCIHLKGEDKYDSYFRGIRTLVQNVLKVDKKAAFHPVAEGCTDMPLILNVKDVPSDITDLGAYALINGGSKAFVARPPKGQKQKGRKNPKNLVDPTLYPTLALSSDVPTETILNRVCHAWSKEGGEWLRIKELQSLGTGTEYYIFEVYNYCNSKMIARELRDMLELAKEDLSVKGRLSEGFESKAIPFINLRRGVPKVPGQDTSVFRKYSDEMQEARRVFHVEVSNDEQAYLKELMEHLKSMPGAIEKMWGPWAHITEPLPYKNAPRGDFKRMIKWCQDGTNYNCSMTSTNMRGIVDVDAEAVVYGADGEIKCFMSLRQVCYQYLKLPTSGETAIAEVHQDGAMGAVEFVYPNTEEAEILMASINAQAAGFFYNLLKDADAPMEFIQDILKEAFEPHLVHEADKCQWDPKTQIVIAPGSLAKKKKKEKLQKQSFFQDVVGQLAAANKAAETKDYANKAVMFNLDGERSIKTMHAKNDGNYANRQEVEKIDLTGGKKKKASSTAKNANALTPAQDDVDHDDDSSDDESGDSSQYTDDSSALSDDESSDSSDDSDDEDESVASG